jgi:putative glutamine amidotransferase
MRIGLSYDQGTPKYRLYKEAVLEAAERYGHKVDVVWLAGAQQPLDRAALKAVDGIVLTGGADVDPSRYGFDDKDGVCEHTFEGRDEAELPIVDEIFARSIPTLAICRGMQFLNVTQGGSLIPDLPARWSHEFDDDEERHAITLDAGSSLSAAVAGLVTGSVSSAHHQAVDRLGRGLRAVAHARDGVVEAIEWTDATQKPWLIAVQWHPERMSLDENLAGPLFHAFFQAVADRSR